MGRETGEKQRPRGNQKPSPHIHTDRTEKTDTDTLSERQRVWPGPGSFLAPSVSLCPRRSLSTNPPPPRWFLAHLPSTSPEQSQREQQRRGKEAALPAQRPNLPSPRKQLQKLGLAQLPGERAPGLQSREGARACVVVRKERGTVCPRGSGLGGRSQVRKPGAPPQARIPQATLCSRSQDTDR